MRERRFVCGVESVVAGGVLDPAPLVDEAGGVVELGSSGSRFVCEWVIGL